MNELEKLQRKYVLCMDEVFDFEDYLFQDGHLALIARYVEYLEQLAGVENSGIIERMREIQEEEEERMDEIREEQKELHELIERNN